MKTFKEYAAERDLVEFGEPEPTDFNNPFAKVNMGGDVTRAKGRYDKAFDRLSQNPLRAGAMSVSGVEPVINKARNASDVRRVSAALGKTRRAVDQFASNFGKQGQGQEGLPQ